MKSKAMVICALATACAFFSVGGSAFAAFELTGQFSGPGSGDGQISTTSSKDAAVDADSGNLFVADSGNGRVEVFAPAAAGGQYLTRIEAPLVAPSGIAIDQAADALYVADKATNAIHKFTISDDPVPVLTEVAAGFTSPAQGAGAGEVASFDSKLAVDPRNGDLLVADSGLDRVSRFNPDGSPDGAAFDGSDSGEGAFAGLLDVAVDSSGDVLVIDADGEIVLDSPPAESQVLRFSEGGTFEERVGPALPQPGAVTVDPAGDEVVVVANLNSYWNEQPLRLHTFAAGGDQLAELELPSETKYSSSPAVAAGGPTGRAYVVLDSPDGGEYGTVAILAYRKLALPQVSFDPIDPEAVRATSATVSGSVDPNGFATDWHLELKRPGETEWKALPSRDAGAGTAPVPFAEELVGLRPGEEYEVRLVAVNADGESSASTSLTTEIAAGPEVELLAPAQVGEATATLRARINPVGLPTRYHFEFGPDASYGSRAPLTDASAGSGLLGREEAQPISGLTPEAPYHFRVVAVNESGTTVSEDATFVTAASGAPGRVVEMVSPPDKNGGDVIPRGSQIKASVDGDRIVFTSTSGFAGAESLGAFTSYFAERGAERWSTVGISPPMAPELVGALTETRYVHFSEDLSTGWLTSLSSLVPGDSPNLDLYSRGLPKGGYELINEPQGALTIPSYLTAQPRQPMVAGTSADRRHVVFESSFPLTEDSPPGRGNVYESVDGEVRLVSILPNGEPAPYSGVAGPGFGAVRGAQSANEYRIPNVISEDGSRVFFTADDSTSFTADIGPEGRLYVRENGATTTLISADRKSTPDGTDAVDARFQSITPDGSVVYFTSAEALTDESVGGTRQLYRYDVDSGELTDLTRDSGASVLRVVAMSSDGAHVYFSAGFPASRLYHWSEETGTREIGELDNSSTKADGNFTTTTNSGGNRWPMQAVTSADGAKLLFVSAGPITGSLFSTPACAQGVCDEVYLYDAVADQTRCLSCPADGTASGDSGFIANAGSISTRPAASHQPRALSADGRLAFFHSPERLLPEDTNTKLDVYQYDLATGEYALLSSGRDDADSYFADATPDGSDVFFLTRARMVGWDTDANLDLYDARVGGGLPEPPPTPAACEGESCQRPSPPPPALPLGSTAVQGGGPDRGDRCARLRSQAQKASRRAASAGQKQKKKLQRKARALKRKAKRCQGGRA